MFIATAIVLLIVTVLYFLYENSERRIKLKKIPADTTVPVFGHLFKIGRTSHDVYKALFSMWKNHGHNTFRLDLGMHLSYVFLSTPDAMEAILSSMKFLNKQDESYRLLVPWLGDGLLTSVGAKWHSRRKILTPAFHFKILDSYAEVFQREAKVLVEKLLQNNSDQDVNVHPYMSRCTLSGICETAMGIDIKAQEEDSAYVKAIEEMCHIIHLRMFSFFTRYDWIFNLTRDAPVYKKCLETIHHHTNSVIAARRNELKDKISSVSSATTIEDEMLGIKKRLAFLDILLLSKTADGSSLSDEDIQEEVNTFMFEGHDTTTSCLSYTMLCLARNQDVQEMVYQEQLAISSGDVRKQATLKEIGEMKYLELVIKESLRMYPAVPIYGRTLLSAFTLPDGTELPENTMVTFCPFLMGMNPELYPEPERFDPERFVNNKSRNPYSYVPFSAGPRNCIGQKFAMLEIKCILSTIVRRMKVSPSPGFEPMLAAEITLKSENGILVRLQERI